MLEIPYQNNLANPVLFPYANIISRIYNMSVYIWYDIIIIYKLYTTYNQFYKCLV